MLNVDVSRQLMNWKREVILGIWLTQRTNLFPLVGFHVHGLVWYSSIFIAPLNSRWPTQALAFGLISSKKRQVLRSDKEVEGFCDKKEAQADGGRRFHREGTATEKDLDFAIVVLVWGTKSSWLPKEHRGRKDEAEVGSLMASRRYLGGSQMFFWCAVEVIQYCYSLYFVNDILTKKKLWKYGLRLMTWKLTVSDAWLGGAWWTAVNCFYYCCYCWCVLTCVGWIDLVLWFFLLTVVFCDLLQWH